MLRMIVTRARELGAPLNMNSRMRSRNAKWQCIDWLFQGAVHLGLSKSDFALELAHDQGGTALHQAARNGNMPQVRYLLEHGGAESLLVKNAMGHTPLSCARLFGPYPEVEAALQDALRRHPQQGTSQPRGGLCGCRRHAQIDSL